MDIQYRKVWVLNQLKADTKIIRHSLMTSGIQFEYSSGSVDVCISYSSVDEINSLPVLLCAATALNGLIVNFEIDINGRIVYTNKYEFSPQTESIVIFSAVVDAEDIKVSGITSTGTIIPVTSSLPVVQPQPTEAQLAVISQQQKISNAMLALRSSDIVVLRCYESAITVPSDWVRFREALRSFLKDVLVDSTLSIPLAPPKPF
jgi:predicted transcriptional regulator